VNKKLLLACGVVGVGVGGFYLGKIYGECCRQPIDYQIEINISEYLCAIKQRINDILQSSGIEASSIPDIFLTHAVLTGDTKPLEDFIADYHFINSTERNEEMSYNKVSPAISKIEERIKQLKQLERDSNDVSLDIQKHKNAIEELTFKLDELGEDILHVRYRIGDLCSQAIIGEGFTEEYLSQFLKEHGFKKQ